MSLTDCTAHSSFRAGDNDQMHMIRHKAICPNRHAASATPLGHERDVGLVILITKERPLPTISSLCYVMWHSRSYHACQSSHDLRLPRNLIRVPYYVWCPRKSPEVEVVISKENRGNGNSEHPVSPACIVEPRYPEARGLCSGSPSRTRTYNLVVNSHPLCRLSYRGTRPVPRNFPRRSPYRSPHHLSGGASCQG